MNISDVSKTYTNSDDMEVQVSQEHLDKAVEIKLELQESTYGRKCNWNKHKQLMEQDGFDDSDINESYRCIIKSYQSKIGKLRKVDSYADYVADGKIEAIKQVVGEMYYAKADNQQVLRELNKIKKGLTTSALAVEELRNVYIDEIDFSVPHYVYKSSSPDSDNKGIAVITDWHVGMVVDDCLGNFFNLEIATNRINKLKKDTLEFCNLFNITNLNIIGLGDWIEHIAMRKNQSQDCEFGKSMQTAKAQKLLLDFIVSMSEYVNVEVQLLAGNHDRDNGDKHANFDGDNATVIINEGIFDMLQIIKSHRIKFIKTLPKQMSIELDLNGKKFKFTHGHTDGGNKRNKLDSHISMDEVFYDCWVHGHLHNYYVQEQNHGRMIIGVGCLMGRNNYSTEMSCATDASQCFIVVKKDGKIIPIKLELQVN